MKKALTSQAIIEQYIETCAILRDTTLSGDSRKGNREGKKIVKIFKELENDIELALQTLPLLFIEDNVVVRTDAAAQCLALKICIDQSVKVLQEIANDESSYGIFAFNAEMTLKVWREQGYLKMYPEQQVRD